MYAVTRRCLLALLASCLGGTALVAQAPPASAGSAAPVCSYRRCALGIAPAWNGLVVVRGVQEERVANLGFFRAGSLDHVFAGNDSAQVVARRAVRVRRVAAVFTDAGALLMAYAAVRLTRAGPLSDTDKALGLTGVASFGVSVPLHFSADGLLSRAIWWRNADFGAP